MHDKIKALAVRSEYLKYLGQGCRSIDAIHQALSVVWRDEITLKPFIDLDENMDFSYVSIGDYVLMVDGSIYEKIVS